MDALAEIERRYGFILPNSYREFVRRGYLELSRTYLDIHEGRWLEPKEIGVFEWPEWINPAEGLVPFARTARADLWCWFKQHITKFNEPAIVHCPHDCFEGHWDAPSLVGWLYGAGLSYCASIWHSESDTRDRVRQWSAVISEFGHHDWATDLSTILQREPFEYVWGPRRIKERGFISLDELKERVCANFGSEYVDAPFTWGRAREEGR